MKLHWEESPAILFKETALRTKSAPVDQPRMTGSLHVEYKHMYMSKKR